MISPNDTFTVYLDEDIPVDDRKPDAQRPAVVYRFGTAGQLREHEHQLQQIAKDHAGADYIDALEACASFNLVEIRNVTRDDGSPAERLSDFMTMSDMRAMAGQITLLAELSEADRKNSDSPSPSRAAASVESAADEPADA